MIALVFAGSAGVAALLFTLDARQRAGEEADDRLAPPTASVERPAVEEGIVSSSPVASAAPAQAPPSIPLEEASHDGPCSSDMLLVTGDLCPFVAHRCLERRKPDRPGQDVACTRYRNEVLCEGALVPMRFCIDRFEYPNRRGVLPAVLISFEGAERVCAAEGKRLCTAKEWMFACEGTAVLPYAVGLARTDACNWDAGPETRVAPTRGPNVATSFGAIDRRTPSGARAACTSPSGALDLAGNVAEWVYEPTNTRGNAPFASVVAGGAWGSGPSACRAQDDGHPPAHRAANLGFRCCADASVEPGSEPLRPRKRKGDGLRPILPRDARP